MNVVPEDIPLTVLYEDDYIVAVNKAAGMCVHPGPGNPNGTFVNALLHHVGTDLAAGLMEATYGPGPGNGGAAGAGGDGKQVATYTELAETPEESRTTPQLLRPGIVHRLDKGTSGVLLAGKTTEAVAALSALFANRKIEKVYMACCVGHPGDSTIVEPIGRDRKNRQLMTVYDGDEDGPPLRPAVSHTKTFAFDGKLSAALVRIETGRTHQIRVHLKHRRTPIIGDEQYGNADWNKRVFKAYGVSRPLLHAYQIAFKHPFTGEALCLQAPVPADMADMLSRMDAQASAMPESELCNPLLDRQSGLLTVDTAVAGQAAPMGSGAAESRGFVPLDRLSTQDEDEFAVNLPEEMGFWRDRYGYGYGYGYGDADGGSGTAVASDSESDGRDE
jgi:23S rRNA pseudouridine1911/1915/1917 synthase